MDRQPNHHLMVPFAQHLTARLTFYRPARFACETPSSPRRRLQCISSFSVCLALALAWMGAGLFRPDGLKVVFASGTTRYVATTGVDVLDCSVAALPCATVQYAADQSAAGDEIRIAGGTYSGVMVRDIVTQVVYISQSLTLRGGYTTTDGFANSDSVANPTTLDAQFNNARVLFITGTNVTGDIENVTIENGHIGGNGSVCPGAGCGGGIYANGELVLSNTTVLSNSARGNGGGAYVAGMLTLISSQILHNTGGSGFFDPDHGGGGAYANGAANLNAGLFQDNYAFYGGGLYAFNSLTLTATQFLSNSAPAGGGGAYARSDTTLNGGLFLNNIVAGGRGGGLSTGSLILTDTQFIGNFGGFAGGGAIALGAATLNGGLFQGNFSGGDGGGLNSFSDLTLTGTRFINNGTGPNAYGGGLHLEGATGNIVNALFARNAAGGALGGAIEVASTAVVQILHTTVSSPTLANGSAIFIGAGTVGISDTIITHYAIGISNTNGTVSEDYNLFFGNGPNHMGTTGGTNDVVGGNPRFINPLTDNYHLAVGSAAIDRGTNVGVMVDIDADARPFGSGYDIGYDEWIGNLSYLPLLRR